MTKAELKRIEQIEANLIKLGELMEITLRNEERFANSLTNILDYMEAHKMDMQPYRPNKLDS